MTLVTPYARRFALGVAGLALAQMAHAESDSRRIIATRPCTLLAKAVNGTIEIKIPTATSVLKTLAEPGDQFQMEGGREYVLVLKESREGLFRFDLQFAPAGAGSTWSCRVQTQATAPFIGIVNGAWSGAPGKVTLSTDRTKFLISLP